MEFMLAGRYEAEQPLGQRPFVDEHLGHDVRLNRPVVLQIVRVSELGALAEQQAFETHMRQVASIDDAGVAHVYDWGREDDCTYVIREPVDGEDLGAMLRRRGSLTAREVAEIGADVAASLATAHRAGVVHGCLDPRSVLTGPHGVKVTGFGLAPWTWPSATGAPAVPADPVAAGVAPASIAPEVRGGGRGDERSDLYTLGALLYTLITGFPPPTAPAGTPLDALAPSRAELADPPPPQLDQLVARLLAGNPAQRYQTAAQLQAALLGIATADQDLAYGPGPEAPPPSGADRPGQRAAVVVALSVITLIAFLTVSLLVWALSTRTSAAEPAPTTPPTTVAPAPTTPPTAAPATLPPTSAAPATTAAPPTTSAPPTTAAPPSSS